MMFKPRRIIENLDNTVIFHYISSFMYRTSSCKVDDMTGDNLLYRHKWFLSYFLLAINFTYLKSISACLFIGRNLHLIIFVTMTYMLLVCGNSNASSTQDPVVLPNSYYSDLYSWNISGGLKQTQLGRGINVGNYLDAPFEGDWTGGKVLVEEDFKIIAKAGFKNVRIPIRWTAHTEQTFPYTINPIFMNRVKEVVGWANNSGLKAIINVHHYTEMMRATKKQKLSHILRLEGIWKQISVQFPLSEYSQADLIFELLNEPHGSIDVNDWNGIIERLLAVIWGNMDTPQANENTQRIVMIGTANWNVPDTLPKLSLPHYANKYNTIITVHNYKPFHFTHQGAKWVNGSNKWIGTNWLGTESETTSLITLFDNMTRWNSKANRNFEIYLGEFGVYSRYADPLQQKAWTAFIAREAEKRNISWAYWEYSSSFGAYDNNAKQWRPHLLEALVPVQQ
ncbi:glycoside hydrolase family 5 protein [Shewanella polaris]|uniref:Glycoside hydrolase family 5 protein n=1 Tax=Shewanella polaris TaxID=2588449 RepID=A0A4Y5YJD0_9GAMM|nr:glycoside hydrolase family 5 protein [Shewanella polaris]QDE32718.1 glycoside hydrolase family 5 protein [Shewanella polaris]